MTASTGPIDRSDPQADAVSYLEAPGTLSATEAARRIDTHAAYIFLAGDRAWKMKRAVRFPYLDFSTVGRRHAALSAELELNRRSAPELYLAVHPLCRSASGAFRIGEGAEVVDWLLEMRRFPDDALLEQVAERDGIGEELVMRLADRIAAFHAAATPTGESSGHAMIGAVIRGNEESLARHGDLFSEKEVGRLIKLQSDIGEKWSGLLDARAGRGRVRHGHGDLHLANIAVIDGEPVLFDCLEFDQALATTDVLYDLAFLIMDLWDRGMRRQANGLLNRYLDVSPDDEDGLPLLPLFLSIRATIRAHALAAQAASAAEPGSVIARARDYFSLATRLLADQERARLVAIGGLSGSGKSTIARIVGGEVGRAPGARIIRSDVLRKRMAGLQPEQPLERNAYSAAASEAVYRAMSEIATRTLGAGYSVICDAVFAKRAERDAIDDTTVRSAAGFVGIWLEAPPATLRTRVDHRSHDASDADLAVVHLQEAYDIGDLGIWHRVVAAGGREDVADRVRAVLSLA